MDRTIPLKWDFMYIFISGRCFNEEERANKTKGNNTAKLQKYKFNRDKCFSA